jgi:hypothetical protein
MGKHLRRLKSRAPRRRGGQPGNQNARKRPVVFADKEAESSATHCGRLIRRMEAEVAKWRNGQLPSPKTGPWSGADEERVFQALIAEIKYLLSGFRSSRKSRDLWLAVQGDLALWLLNDSANFESEAQFHNAILRAFALSSLMAQRHRWIGDRQIYEYLWCLECAELYHRHWPFARLSYRARTKPTTRRTRTALAASDR